MMVHGEDTVPRFEASRRFCGCKARRGSSALERLKNKVGDRVNGFWESAETAEKTVGALVQANGTGGLRGGRRRADFIGYFKNCSMRLYGGPSASILLE
jgi:hypothetical protein